MRHPTPAVQAFRRTLWRPGSDSTDDLDAAFARGETARVIAAAQARRDAGLATPAEGPMLWNALLEADRFAEALAVLEAPQAGAPAADHALALAAALAGLGRLDDAVRALGAADPGGGPDAEALGQLLGDAATGGLAGARAWLTLGAYDPAADALVEAVATAPADAHADLRSLLCQVLVHVSPAKVDELIRRCEPVLRAGRGDPDLQAAHCLALADAAHGQWTDAVERLGAPAAQVRHAQESRRALARCVGGAVIDQLRPRFQPRPGRRIVDVFPFFDELLILQLRLEEMAPWVDRFVIIEADQTFTGRPKPLHFAAHRERFARWADKIVHVPISFPPWVSSHWAREFYQRDAGLATVAQICGPDDLVVTTDVDEILDRRAIEGFEHPFAALHMDTYAYWFNVRLVEHKRVCRGAIWRAGLLDRFGMSYARLLTGSLFKRPLIREAGWHFTSIRPREDLPAKFNSYSHVQHANRDETWFRITLDRIRAGQDPDYQRIDFDDRFPATLHRQAEELAEFIL